MYSDMISAAEKAIFEAFVKFRPDFAGKKVVCEAGPDPPDYICANEAGARIGVELGEWLNEAQIRESKERERIEDSYCSVVKSEDEASPPNIGWVYFNQKDLVSLAPSDAPTFKTELYQCVKEVDDGWLDNPECDDPQGYTLRDLGTYPTLAKYLHGLHFRSTERIKSIRGIAWISFRPHGGAYSPDDAVNALLELLNKKINKYANLRRDQKLSELYLVAYYDQGLIHNTPYLGLDLGLDDIAEIAAIKVARNPGPFQKVFLFNSLPQDMAVYQLWP
jgi:hypothetical protein